MREINPFFHLPERIRGGAGRTGHAGVHGWDRRECPHGPCPDLRWLGFLGIELEEKRNGANEGVISAETGRICVRVIRTDEEWMIAQTVRRVLGLAMEQKHPHENK